MRKEDKTKDPYFYSSEIIGVVWLVDGSLSMAQSKSSQWDDGQRRGTSTELAAGDNKELDTQTWIPMCLKTYVCRML